MSKRFRVWLRFCWGRVQFFFRSQVDCWQLTFTPRHAVKVEVAEQFAIMRAATKAIRAMSDKPDKPVPGRINVTDRAGRKFTLPQSDLNSLAVMLYDRGGFPTIGKAKKYARPN